MSDGVMKAVLFTARRRAELRTVDFDGSPLGPTELRGSTVVSLISPGTELSGGFLGEDFPRPPGYAAVFRIEETGGEVNDVSPGDLVFTMGAHQSQQRCDRREAVRVPGGLPAARAVAARLMGVSMTTLATTAARSRELVLVTGLGIVGNLAAQIFSTCAYRVVGVEPRPERRALAESIGLKDVRESVPLDDDEVRGRVALVLECSGHEQAALDGCRAVRRSGEVVLIGVPWQRRTDLLAHELLDAVFHRYAVLRSGWEWEIPRHSDQFSHRSIFGNFRTALRWLEDGRVRVDGLYPAVSPEDAGRVYEDLLEKRADGLTAAFDWGAVG